MVLVGIDGKKYKKVTFEVGFITAEFSDPDDIAVVLRKVREKVMKTKGNKQQPWEYGALTGGAVVLSAIKPK